MDYVPTGTRNYYWQIFHYQGKRDDGHAQYRYCGSTTDRWDGRDIKFTSPKREREFRELHVPGAA